jgi:hypothetical protein
LLDEDLGRVELRADVAPGQETRVEGRFELPAGLPQGAYRLYFDLVAENVSWFEDQGASPWVHEIRVSASSEDEK